MKKLLVGLILSLCSLTSQAAVSAAVEWDIQTVGLDTNGCGFKAGAAGADRSQSGATPFVAVDGATITAVVQATTTDLLVTGYTVAAADVGNIVNIASGATVGFYEIVSVNTGTNTWTLDRAAGTAAQSAVAAMGGSCLTPHKVMAETTALVAGQTIHIKNGTYSRTSTIALGASGTSTGYIKVSGYNATHGDITQWAHMANAPVLTSATNSVALMTTSSRSLWYFTGIKFTHTATTRGAALLGSGSTSSNRFDLVQFDGCLNAISSIASSVTGAMSRVEVKNSTGAGIYADGNFTLIDSWVHDNASYGIRNTGSSTTQIIRSVINNNVTAGLHFTNPLILTIIDSTIAYNLGASTDGINFGTSGPTQHFSLVNSILYGNGRYNMNVTATGISGAILHNAWGGAGTANMNNAIYSTGIAPITLGADPFVASGSGNFGLNTAATGGALLRSLGYPGTFPGGTMVGYTSTGPIQHQNAASSVGFIRLK